MNYEDEIRELMGHPHTVAAVESRINRAMTEADAHLAPVAMDVVAVPTVGHPGKTLDLTHLSPEEALSAAIANADPMVLLIRFPPGVDRRKVEEVLYAKPACYFGCIQAELIA